MKRNFLYAKSTCNIVVKFLISFLIGITSMLVLLLIASIIHLKYNLNDFAVEIMSIAILSIGVSICSIIFTALGKVKGYIAGLISGGLFVVVKVIYTLISGKIGGRSILTYIILICCAVISGIITAGKRYKKKW